MTQKMRTGDSTWLALRQKANFEPFFEGLVEYLKQKPGEAEDGW